MTSQDLLSLVSQDSELRKVAATKGGEWAGPCPFCGGTDRLRVWPEHEGGQFWCRQCNKGGDAIAYLVERGELTPKEAGELRRGRGAWQPGPLAKQPAPPPPKHTGQLCPPGEQWQQAARAFVDTSKAALWADTGTRALSWLRGRGLADDTIRAAGLGYNHQAEKERWQSWGEKRVKLYRGIVIPWEIGGDLWRVNIRRGRRPAGESKYYSPAGAANGLYNADALSVGKPAILVEGEFDALALGQAAGDLAAPVATGSTTWARRPRWIAALALCSLVLVSFDAEEDKGDQAAAWWVNVLDNARRWRPLWADANAMAQDGADLRAWLTEAIGGNRPDPELARKLEQAREWAAEAEAHDLPCNGFASWAAWLADTEAALCGLQASGVVA